MSVIASITTSLDGYIAGPNDAPGRGLGEGGEVLHYWVFGGPWSYETGPRGAPRGEAREFLDEELARTGAIVIGRWMFEVAEHWGERNPWGVPVFVVTHRPHEEPEGGEFTFVGGFPQAIELAREAAGEKDVAIGGGAHVIRQGLATGVVDELTIVIAPVILGGGKRLFEGFTQTVHLERLYVRPMAWGTVLQYRVKRYEPQSRADSAWGAHPSDEGARTPS